MLVVYWSVSQRCTFMLRKFVLAADVPGISLANWVTRDLVDRTGPPSLDLTSIVMRSQPWHLPNSPTPGQLALDRGDQHRAHQHPRHPAALLTSTPAPTIQDPETPADRQVPHALANNAAAGPSRWPVTQPKPRSAVDPGLLVPGHGCWVA